MKEIVVGSPRVGWPRMEWAWSRAVEMLETYLLYCCEALVKAWMCWMMNELLVCCSFVAVSMVAVI